MKAKHFITYLVLFLASAMLFSYCKDGRSEDVVPLTWTSGSHHLIMKNKYTHEVYIDAAADTLQFNYVDECFHLCPFIKRLEEQDGSFEYTPCKKTVHKAQRKSADYIIETHEQHISRPTIKADLKDGTLTIFVPENASVAQRKTVLTLDDAKYGIGCPSLGYIVIYQAGKLK